MDGNIQQKNIKKVIVSEEEIKKAVKEASKKINALYDGRPLLLVCVLKGACIFFADLCREITVPCEIDFLCAKSYSGTESTGTVEITRDVDRDMSRYHVVIVEDILDTGRTLKGISEIIKERNPLSCTIVTLLDKPSRRVIDFSSDISLFTIPDLFVVGYGLDYDEKYRNLKYIGEYIPE